MSSELDHPCRQTCSGWKQGYERGVKDGMERAAQVCDDHTASLEGILREEGKQRGQILSEDCAQAIRDAAKESPSG